MANDRIQTTDETLSSLREKAKEDDNFFVKVMRRAHPGVGPTTLATFSGAQMQHFINPELWIPALMGGGKISLQGYHPTDLNKPIGGFVQFDISDPPKDVNVDAVSKPDWRGPSVLEFPKKEARRQQEDLPLYQSPPGPDHQGNSATSINQPWSRSPGGGPARQEYSGNSDWQRGAAALEAERRTLEKERLDAERQRHRDELEAQKKSHEADMRALKTEMMGAIQQNRAPTGPDPIATLMMEMVKQAAADRAAAQLQAAEDRRAEAARQERAEARFQSMLEKMNDKPKDNPLEMFKLVNELVSNNSKKNDGIVEAQTKMMHSMSEMMGQQVGVAMDFVSAAADMQLGARGEESPGWVKGLESVVKTVGAMAKGAAVRAPQPVPPQTVQPQLPPTAPVPEAKSPMQPPSQQQPAPAVIVQVEMAIRNKIPVATIAKALVDNFTDPSIQQALAESAGDLKGYVTKRLGNWINEDAVNNPPYLKALFAEIESQFVKAGMIPSEAEEEDAEVSESDEGDDGDDE